MAGLENVFVYGYGMKGSDPTLQALIESWAIQRGPKDNVFDIDVSYPMEDLLVFRFPAEGERSAV